VKTFLGPVRAVVKAHKQTAAGNLIAQLNLMIRGGTNDHRHVVSKVVFTPWIQPSSSVGGPGPHGGTRRSPVAGWRSNTFACTTDVNGPSWRQARVPRGNRTNACCFVQAMCPFKGMSKSKA
jgi:hypothetical protein